MNAIVIRRCRLRIVRRGGWAWGARPGDLLRAAIAAIPEWIAEELERLFPDPRSDVRIAAPVQIRVAMPGAARMRLADGTSSAAPDVMLAGVRSHVADALRRAVEPHVPRDEEPLAPDVAEVEAPVVEDVPSSPALRWLVQMARSGELAALLRLLSAEALEQWSACLFPELVQMSRAAETVDATTSAEWRAQVASSRDAFGPPPSSRPGRLQLLLFVAGRFTAQFGIASWSRAMREMLLSALPLDEKAGSVPPDVVTTRVSLTDAIVFDRPRRQIARVVGTRSDLEISCALPFLLLNPLAGVGYWSALGAALEAGRLGGDAPLFAASLAFKVLAPPARGWRREGTAVIAAAFAGLATIDEAALAELARRCDASCSFLDAALLRGAVKDFHQGDPIVVCRADDTWLLAETVGAAPFACASRVDDLVPALRQFPSPLLATDEASALGTLDDEGFRFLAFVRPRFPCRAIPLPHARTCWTNDPHGGMARLASRLIELPDAVRQTWTAIAADRPSSPLATHRALDRSLSLAAATALGSIATRLWRERETCDPRLALERFHDLSAVVHFDDREIRVRLPLGRRFTDLRDHGVLDTVRGLPWLSGRNVVLTGG